MTVAIEAFKADAIDWRTENSAKNWATAYDFPAMKDGRVVKEEFPILSSGGMQAFAFNIRRQKFPDPRVRRAFNFALNFEELNKQLFFGQYARIKSYFEGMELASSGLAGRRRARNPRNRARQGAAGGLHHALHQSGHDSRNRSAPICAKRRGCCSRPATRSATEAGQRQDRRAVHGRMLIDRPEWERIVLPYKPSLERLGIQMSLPRR